MIKNYGEKIEFLDDCWVLPVSLTHDNLGPGWDNLHQKMPKSGIWNMDARQLKEIDSSTLSFFLECLRTARQRKVSLKISSLNSKIKALLNVYGVGHLFEQVIEDQ